MNLGGRLQGGIFQQATEFLLGGVMMRPFFSGGVGHGLIFHFESVQAHDAEIFLTLFPDLALLQLHRRHRTRIARGHFPRSLGKDSVDFWDLSPMILSSFAG